MPYLWRACCPSTSMLEPGLRTAIMSHTSIESTCASNVETISWASYCCLKEAQPNPNKFANLTGPNVHIVLMHALRHILKITISFHSSYMTSGCRTQITSPDRPFPTIQQRIWPPDGCPASTSKGQLPLPLQTLSHKSFHNWSSQAVTLAANIV